MNTSEASNSTRFKVGLFTVVGLVFIGVLTVYVNDKPYWYRPCQLVHINVDDATGLKSKSPIRSLGLEIGYLKTVELSETHVTLGICITAPVEVLPSTRAYLRGEGFLGDKFVELKPVKFLGGPRTTSHLKPSLQKALGEAADRLLDIAVLSASAAEAQEPKPARKSGEGREIPVGAQTQDMQQIVNRVDELVNEMTGLTQNLKQAINPEELRSTMRQLNRTLENASRTLAPEGGLNQTAQRTLAKLEDSIEQLRDMMTRINRGEGSVGMLINDPTYAEEIREGIRNVNKLLSKVGGVRFQVDIGGEIITAYEEGSRAWFRLGIWPKADRYYLLGISVDPRGRRTKVTTTTAVQGGPTTVTETTQLEETGLLLTGMVGKLFFNHRLDLAIGALNGDGAVSIGFNLGRSERPDEIQLTNSVYSRGGAPGMDNRVSLVVRPYLSTYLRAGIESVRYKVNGQIPYFFGAGIAFDDEDIKLLFTLR
ncbi:MAG: hypothetical protein A2428_08990 [Bdellovibrionales bacterium RIFOXYC1_FULL_54_43]|nr:MAG: hypothetical protein A2428_08990 [Bdellovibrionales bacterium RIFOXYC1_FULL_54_43]OFZ79605.1 MAG: hypothetical protein A2603_00630 [Bdellovibrionales bacterium RIFOXYD1_FULL_55_31]